MYGNPLIFVFNLFVLILLFIFIVNINNQIFTEYLKRLPRYSVFNRLQKNSLFVEILFYKRVLKESPVKYINFPTLNVLQTHFYNVNKNGSHKDGA